MEGKALLDFYPEELEAYFKARGLPAYRAKQVFSWLHKGRGIDEMTNLPKALREQLAQGMRLGGVRIEKSVTSKLDGTVKFLFALEDDNIIEGVLMHYKHGDTLCISSQVGCRMGCAFCASTLAGRVRDLHAGEMLGQVLSVNRLLEEKGGHISNIVMMGSGEPLDNYEESIRFLRLVSHPQGVQIGLRHISLSTCGLPQQIRQLAREGLPVTLCLSLHAPDDALRREIMPIARQYGLDEVMQAMRDYVQATGRRAIFEYALIRGVNDADEQAMRLAKLVRGMQCHINLIPINAVVERNWAPPPASRIQGFLNVLNKCGASATIRREMGDDIEGACGQLRRRYLEREEPSCNIQP
ncbi:23S rRNA (adenine(2503)-C(2))-methyltransferase RlmN [Christensenellaceae bacterium NSJ-44]|uniref:Probable dual-specificity RNA methyltransferase RlmN n=1 Tax=Luoshenia tenuis TaxID=2763654 RepID=A0A926CZW2_9FIRM|nr:23S rRNA (adenine(2503)-C(2))-methyltransferase RlmN [Luoshenia tenuis]MBC8528796.1 23S rRNA (adenine(2503)-C(2))-methyltransferase RlmN [Luoshenia tenuis]